MNEYISDLNSAIKKVEPEFVSTETVCGFGKVIEPDNPFVEGYRNEGEADVLELAFKYFESRKQSIELNFSFRLYYYWQTKILNKEAYKNLKLNGEINKANWAFALNYAEREDGLLDRLISEGVLQQKSFIPDLVLHGGQDNIDYQKLVVEIKVFDRLNEKKFKKDFYKLIFFQKLYNFKYVAFVVVGAVEIDVQREKVLKYLSKVQTDLAIRKDYWFIFRSKQHAYAQNLENIESFHQADIDNIN